MKKIFLIFFLFSFFAHGVCAKDADTLSTRHDTLSHAPNFLYQFLGGNAGFALPFFLLGGNNLLQDKDDMGFDLFFGLIGCGYSVTKIAEVTSGMQGSYWAGIGGALLSTFLGGLLYAYTSDHIKNQIIRFFTLSIPPTLVSMLWVDLTLKPDKDESPSSKFQGYIFPELSKNIFRLRFLGKF